MSAGTVRRTRRIGLAALPVAVLFGALLLALAAAGPASSTPKARFQPNIVPTQTPEPTPSPTPAPAIPIITGAEIRPDRTVLVTWSQAQGAASYEIGVRSVGGPGAWTVVAERTAPVSQEIVARVIRPSDSWSAEPGTGYELAVRAVLAGDARGAWSAAAPVSTSLSVSSITQVAATASSITIAWDAVPIDDPFAAYEIHLAPVDVPIEDCLAATITDRAVTTTTLSQLPEACDGGPLEATAYAAGVRVVRTTTPRTHDAIQATTVRPAGVAASPEGFAVAEVAGTWEIVDTDGTPAVWNGVNLRRGELVSFAYSTTEMRSLLDNGFDTVRVAMEWDRFEKTPGVFERAHFQAVDRTLRFAEQVGINVILDPIHLADPPEYHIPLWAWDRSTNQEPGEDGALNTRLILDTIRENAQPYLRYVAQRYADHPQVVAIDLVNEPREPVGWPLDTVNAELITLYHDLVDVVRDVDADKPLILEPFYGNSLVTGDRLETLPDATIADPNPDPSDFTNIIWSIHDYYAGREGGPNDDGYTDNGYPKRGKAQDGTRHRTESWTSTGCYPSGPTSDSCTNDTSRTDVLIPSMIEHVARQFDAAQQANMAMFIGEYGVPHAGSYQGQDYAGWSGGPELYTDKNVVFDSFGAAGVSRALWEWRTDVDPTFGMYTRATRQWHEWTHYASGLAQAPAQGAIPSPTPEPPHGAGPEGALAAVEVMHATSCLAENGRVDTNVVNTTSDTATYRVEFPGLSPRQSTLAPGDWWRMPITGRAEGTYSITVLRAGVVVSVQDVMVSCDSEPPVVTDPFVRVVNACRGDRGYVLFQFVNQTAEAIPIVISFEGVPNRSTTVLPYAQATRAVTGRGDGLYEVLITSGGETLSAFDLTVACNG